MTRLSKLALCAAAAAVTASTGCSLFDGCKDGSCSKPTTTQYEAPASASSAGSVIPAAPVEGAYPTQRPALGAAPAATGATGAMGGMSGPAVPR